jgi:hypothetical protein
MCEERFESQFCREPHDETTIRRTAYKFHQTGSVANKHGLGHPTIKDDRAESDMLVQCRVIGGSEECLHFVHKHTKDYAVAPIRRVNVRGAFNTVLMKPARRKFESMFYGGYARARAHTHC